MLVGRNPTPLEKPSASAAASALASKMDASEGARADPSLKPAVVDLKKEGDQQVAAAKTEPEAVDLVKEDDGAAKTKLEAVDLKKGDDQQENAAKTADVLDPAIPVDTQEAANPSLAAPKFPARPKAAVDG